MKEEGILAFEDQKYSREHGGGYLLDEPGTRQSIEANLSVKRLFDLQDELPLKTSQTVNRSCTKFQETEVYVCVNVCLDHVSSFHSQLIRLPI